MIDGMDEDEWEAICDAAYDPETSAEQLDEFVVGSGVVRRGLSWRRGVAANPNTWESTLMYLAADEDWTVRVFVSRNRNATPAILMKLVQGGDLDVLEGVIRHPNATLEVFSAVADPRRPDPYQREMVAECKYAPVEILMRLAQDASPSVRYEVSCNPNCPPLVKLYLQSGQYGGMTLQEFLEATNETI